MRRTLAWTGGMLLAALLAVVVAALLFSRQVAEFAASRALGRAVEIAGSIDIDYSLSPTLHASDVRIANPAWARHPNLLEVQALTLSLDLRSLFGERLLLPQVSLTQPSLYLERSAQGRLSWDVGGGSAAAQQAQSPQHPPYPSDPKPDQSAGARQGFPIPAIGHAWIRDGRVHYLDHGSDRRYQASIASLEGRAPADRPLRLHARGSIAQQPFELHAQAGPLARLEGADQPYPLALDLDSRGASARLEGSIAEPLCLAGVDLGVSLLSLIHI